MISWRDIINFPLDMLSDVFFRFKNREAHDESSVFAVGQSSVESRKRELAERRVGVPVLNNVS